MGRGRQKAKQTKVARELKYHTHETDLSALAAELTAAHEAEGDDVDPTAVEPDYSKWIDDEDEDSEEE